MVSRLLWCGRSRFSLRWRLSWKPRAPKLQPRMPKFWRRLRLRSRLFELVLVQVLALTARCRLSCPLSWLLVTLARLLALMLVLVVQVLERRLRLRSRLLEFVWVVVLALRPGSRWRRWLMPLGRKKRSVVLMARRWQRWILIRRHRCFGLVRRKVVAVPAVEWAGT